MRGRLRQKVQDTYLIFKYAAKQHGVDRVNRMAAAVAYRAIFAMAPLLILAVSIVGLVVGSDAAAQAEILEGVERLLGPDVAEALGLVFVQLADTGAITGVVGLILLLWTGSSLFLELQNDLNDIFDIPYEKTAGILQTVRKRGIGFLLALSLGLVIVLVVLLNSLWQFIGNFLPDDFAVAHDVITLLTPVVSLVLLPLVIGLFVQTLSQVRVRWRAVWWGSLFTSIAVLVTSYGASIYFGVAGETAAGLAGALFVILLLANIFSSVFLFGAELTRAYELCLETGAPPPAAFDSSVHKEAEPITSRDDGN